MSLIACWECGREISDAAPACPACGAPAQAVAASASVWTRAGFDSIVEGDTIRLVASRPDPYRHGSIRLEWESEDDLLLGKSGRVVEVDDDGTFKIDIDPRNGWFAPTWIGHRISAQGNDVVEGGNGSG